MTYKKILQLSLFSILFTLMATPALAQADPSYGLETTRQGAGITKTEESLPQVIGRGINTLFGLVGAIFLIIILLGGFTWMTAAGNEEKVATAKKMINNSINGILIVFLSYALVFVILFALRAASEG